ncbi:olfactory receptor 2F1-like [Kryptolebias marmoratus]|uniref:olfactory receptor 2F1-like n=1 Tax=Kryptolebias marmoratus TaxID=37003 RepID=UPI0007F8ABAC|nr:olfactory receptor 2F1-like [Kryptolebias marmoratus]
MENEVNISYITLCGFVELNKYRYLYFTIMFTIYVLIICGNSIIVYLIWSNKSLHEPMYIFIAALLVNCVLNSTVVYPKLLVDFLSEKQIISYSTCIFQFFMFYTLGGAEFILLAVMAYDRYVSICKPLRYHAIMTNNMVNTFLILAWFLPACHITVSATLSAKAKLCNLTLNGIMCNNAVFTLQCMRSKPLTVFGLINLINLILFPVLFIIFTYAKIFILSYQNFKTLRGKAAETCIPHLLVIINCSYLSAYDVIKARVESDFPVTARFLMTMQLFVSDPLFNPVIYGLKMKEISKCLKLFFLRKS